MAASSAKPATARRQKHSQDDQAKGQTMSVLARLGAGLHALAAVALLAVLVALPLRYVADTFSRDVSRVPVVAALTAGAVEPVASRAQAAVAEAPRAAAPEPVEAAVSESGYRPAAAAGPRLANPPPRESGAVSRSLRPVPRPHSELGEDWTGLPPRKGARAGRVT